MIDHMKTSNDSVSVAFLGVGARARGVIGNWIDAGARVAALVDPSADSLAATRAKFGSALADAEDATDIDGYLKRADCDLVVINSWDPHHAENLVQCFDAGRNAMVAKPMTQTLEEADRVYRAWRRSGRIGIVDMQIRTSLLVREAMRIIDAGTIGEVKLIDCFDMVGFGGAFQRSPRSRRRDMIHSLTLAKGVHFLDLCNLFMGDDPVRVFATGGRNFFGGDMPDDLHCADCDRKDTCLYDGAKAMIGGQPFPNRSSHCVYAKEVDVVDNLAATIEYRRGGRISYAECHGTVEYETRYDIIGTKGSLYVRYAMDNRLFLELRLLGSPSVERIPIYANGAHGGGDVQIVRDVVGAIREGRQPQPDIRAGRQAVALCQAVDRSIDTRMPVDIPLPPEA